MTTEQETTQPEQPEVKHRKSRQPKEDKQAEIEILKQRIGELENLHPELKPKTPTPIYLTILKWLVFFIIIVLFLYGLYLFYCYDQLGKDITIPFWGILRH